MATVDGARAGGEVLSTGFLGLDRVLGTGGFPRGHSVEIFGPGSCGKRSLVLQVIAGLQGRGGVAVFIGPKHTLDVTYAKQLGVDLDDLLVSVPESHARALEMAAILVRSAAVDLISIYFASPPPFQVHGLLAELDRAVRRSRSVLVFITAADSPCATQATIQMKLNHAGIIMKGREVIGDRSRAIVVKNELTLMPGEAQLDVLHGSGVSREADLLDWGIESGVLKENDGALCFGNMRLGYTRLQMCEFLARNPGVCHEIRRDVGGHR